MINYGDIKARGGSGGYKNRNILRRVGDHPDGHPGEGKSHDCPHIHVYDEGNKTIAKIEYKRL